MTEPPEKGQMQTVNDCQLGLMSEYWCRFTVTSVGRFTWISLYDHRLQETVSLCFIDLNLYWNGLLKLLDLLLHYWIDHSLTPLPSCPVVLEERSQKLLKLLEDLSHRAQISIRPLCSLALGGIISAVFLSFWMGFSLNNQTVALSRNSLFPSRKQEMKDDWKKNAFVQIIQLWICRIIWQIFLPSPYFRVYIQLTDGKRCYFMNYFNSCFRYVHWNSGQS